MSTQKKIILNWIEFDKLIRVVAIKAEIYRINYICKFRIHWYKYMIEIRKKMKHYIKGAIWNDTKNGITKQILENSGYNYFNESL